ncbi:hypothetical protein [Clostridium folliculivorans]|uniref:DUF2140 family protein n=1 Tax=Clostridium folliculivorans TaxID=2886038 RepID=A0A9W5Y605_9CLOT|nr:hypothetical protein [Clostridium folliculivorans]GKU27217.1 hypothetical protein CFOLD11_40440 [Clostridium folliculivorans]GKU31630.1 hypothetical protein CFB3_37370 [Clostridium folliculivorans]
MKRVTKVAWSTIIIVIIVLIGVGLFLIKPEKEVQYFDASKINTSDTNLFTNKDIDLKTFTLNVNIDENKLNSLIATNSNVEDFKAEIVDGKIIFYKKVQLIGALSTQYKMVFDLKTENNNVVMLLENAFIGKIKIANATVMEELKKNENQFMSVDEAQNKITVKLQNVKISDAKIENNIIKIKVDFSQYLKNGLGFIKDLFNK